MVFGIKFIQECIIRDYLQNQEGEKGNIKKESSFVYCLSKIHKEYHSVHIVDMGKIKKRNKEKRKNLNGITLKEMVDKGIVDKHYHLKEQRFVGGLTMPNEMNRWWKDLPK